MATCFTPRPIRLLAAAAARAGSDGEARRALHFYCKPRSALQIISLRYLFFVLKGGQDIRTRRGAVLRTARHLDSWACLGPYMAGARGGAGLRTLEGGGGVVVEVRVPGGLGPRPGLAAIDLSAPMAWRGSLLPQTRRAASPHCSSGQEVVV